MSYAKCIFPGGKKKNAQGYFSLISYTLSCTGNLFSLFPFISSFLSTLLFPFLFFTFSFPFVFSSLLSSSPPLLLPSFPFSLPYYFVFILLYFLIRHTSRCQRYNSTYFHEAFILLTNTKICINSIILDIKLQQHKVIYLNLFL